MNRNTINLKKSVLWKLIERIGVQIIQLITVLLLTRLLLPKDFGVLAIATVILSLSLVVVQSGFNAALIRKKEITENELTSVFFLNMFLSILIYTIIFISAPYIEIFFNYPNLSYTIKILLVIVFFYAFNSIQQVIIAREMLFKKLFIVNLVSTLVSSVVAIYLAIEGYGYKALIFQQLIYYLISSVILFYLVRWKPKKSFSLQVLRELWEYSSKILLATLIDNFYIHYKSLLIGKNFSPGSLGIYNKAEQLPNLAINSIVSAIQSVMFPYFSKIQDDKLKLNLVLEKAVLYSSFLVFPLMIYLIIVSNVLVEILFTDKWIAMVPILQVLCIYFALLPMQSLYVQVINAVGRSDIILKIEAKKKAIGILIISISLYWGVIGIAWASVIVGVISLYINVGPLKKIIGYDMKKQLKCLAPLIFMSIIPIFFTGYLQKNVETAEIKLILITTTFWGIYLIGGKLLKFEIWEELSQKISKRMRN